MHLSQTAQRICALALTAMVAVFAYLGLIHWWLVAPLQLLNEDEELLLASYQRYAVLDAQRVSIQARLESIRQQPLPAGSLLVASGPQAATAQLMQLASERLSLAPASGVACSLTNRMPQPVEPVGRLLKVRVNVDLICGIESLTATLHRLENEPPYIKVDAFSIRRMDPTSTTQSQQSRLAIKLQLSGFLSASDAAKNE
jgi:general secretion pathway protein M